MMVWCHLQATVDECRYRYPGAVPHTMVWAQCAMGMAPTDTMRWTTQPSHDSVWNQRLLRGLVRVLDQTHCLETTLVTRPACQQNQKKTVRTHAMTSWQTGNRRRCLPSWMLATAKQLVIVPQVLIQRVQE